MKKRVYEYALGVGAARVLWVAATSQKAADGVMGTRWESCGPIMDGRRFADSALPAGVDVVIS